MPPPPERLRLNALNAILAPAPAFLKDRESLLARLRRDAGRFAAARSGRP